MWETPKISKISIATSRYVPVARRPDQCKCAYPGCNKPAEELHHPNRFALYKNHRDLVPLCRLHHLIAHAGLIKNEYDAPRLWQITTGRDKTDPKYMIDQKFIEYGMTANNTKIAGGVPRARGGP